MQLAWGPYLRTIKLAFTLFLGGFSALLSAQPFGFLRWTVADGLPQSEVTALAEDGVGYLWVGTNGGGVARFDGQDFEVFTTADGLPGNFVEAITTNEAGEVVVMTSRGTAVLPLASQRFSGAAAGAKIAKGAGQDWEAVGERLRQLNPSLRAFQDLEQAGKAYLAGTAEGLYLLNEEGQPIGHFTAPNDLPDNRINVIIKDRQGRHWIGTRGGLVRMIPTGLRQFQRDQQGLPVRHLSALHVRRNGEVWVGLDRSGLRIFADNTFRKPPLEDPTRGVTITDLAEDGTGRLFVATQGRGVVVIDPDSLSVALLQRRSGLPDDRILAVLPDTGGVWAVGFDEGIGKIRQTDSTLVVDKYGPSAGLPAATFTAALQMPAGDLLLATTAGTILQWRPDSLIRTLGEANGLPAGKIIAMGLRRQTQLWVAISGQGLFYTDLRTRKPTFAGLPARIGGLATDIRQILLPPDRAEVWLATTGGLDRIFLDRDGRPDWRRRYGRAEGFPAAEPWPGAATIDPIGGQLLFGTSAGLVVYTTEDGDGYLAPPATQLAQVNLFYAPLRPQDYVMKAGVPGFSADQNHFNFRFVAVDLTYPDRIRYQWRLRGVEEDWSPPSAETTVRYAGLGPGSYHFAVRATTDGGKTWGEVATFRFRIDSPLWRQPWFLGLLALGIGGGLVSGFYAFYRRVQRTEARKRRQLEVRNQLLKLEQQALQLQMNPHFIFNALNSIRGLLDGEHAAEARLQITRFATLMRGILNNSRRERITLAEEMATLSDYLKMEQFCQPFPFTFLIEPPAGTDPEEISMPSMLLQPFLENSVLHGLAGREAGGHISVKFVLRGRGLECTVTDNGIGRTAAAARRQGRPAGHKSVALQVTAQRLKALKGRLEITDVVEEQGQVGGTRVTLFVPVETW